MKLVFNSLSLKGLDSIDQIIISLDNLFKIKKRLKETGFVDFLFHSSIQSFPLSNGSIFISFLEENKNNENKDYIDYLIHHVVNVPFIDELQGDINLEVAVNGENFEGFKIVHEDSGYALKSFFTETLWEKFLVNCEVEKLDQDANIIKNGSSLLNIGKINEIDETTWIYKYLQNESLETFINEVSDLKYIVISQDAMNAIQGYGGNISLLGSLLNNLKVLNSYCESFWKFGEMRLSHIKQLGVTTIKPESSETLKKFGSERKFVDISGKRSPEPFSIHFNLPDDKRCYINSYIDEDNNKKIFIAYVGKHLRTVKFS
ncbi:hypothetical protein [Acinetobacter variabilis]|uniref:hypothetical protein n=1 Tax=Acinetobacter variabilis TaxID=70346 RepID=UPI00289C5B80|nr:hypothetical protein [Acinetobacter variabilis]